MDAYDESQTDKGCLKRHLNAFESHGPHLAAITENLEHKLHNAGSTVY